MATLGGPAIPVSVQTGGQVEGGPALPVAVVTDGRAVEGGPSMPVVVVTSGPVQGGPTLPVVAASGAQESQVMAGRAIPVYVVSGSLSSGTAPVNTVLPVISGTLAIGSVLSTTDGTWTGAAPITYTYQWQRNGVDIGGETNNTYTLTASDPGTTITVEVTATNALGSASATSAGVTPSSLLTSLISYWKLEEPSGNRIDAVTASGNDLTPANTPGNAVGRVGNAVRLTSASSQSLSHIDNASLSTGDIDFTIAAWVYLDTLGTERCIASRYTSTLAGEWLLRITSGNAINFFVTNESTGVSANVGITVISATTWTLVIAWHDSAGNTINISVDNAAVQSTAWANTIQDSNQPFIIGATNAGASRLMNGRIDEVGFWKRLLTPAERTAIYNSGNGATYPF